MNLGANPLLIGVPLKLRIHELKQREDYDGHFLASIEAILHSLAPNDQHEVRAASGAAKAKDQLWYLHPFFEVYVTRSVCDDALAYLRQAYRHTPFARRRIAQALFVDVAAFPLVFRSSLQPAFRLNPGLPNADRLMLMPGNQRFRVFDFERRRIRLVAKDGFTPEGLSREYALRQMLAHKFSWILPSYAIAEDQISNTRPSIYEEELLNAYPLNREAQESRRLLAETRAFRALEELESVQSYHYDPEFYLSLKRGHFEEAKENLCTRFGGLNFEHVEACWSRCEDLLLEVDQIEVCLSHGDFQAGNILIRAKSDPLKIAIIDWEDAGYRASCYDALTYCLSTRSPHKLDMRLQTFIEAPPRDLCQSFAQSPRILLAQWFIEEWIWLCEVSSRDGISKLPNGLVENFRLVAGMRKLFS